MNNLLEYQKTGVKYIISHKGTLLADEMGLGKTIQAISAINEDPKIEGVLIICPASLTYNWNVECHNWLTRSPKWMNIYSYDSVHKVTKDYVERVFDTIILDEMHYIKDPKTKRYKTIIKLIETYKPRRIIGLTGTPFLNRPLELWPLLQIINPEVWDPPPKKRITRSLPSSMVILPNPTAVKPKKAKKSVHYWRFANRYCDPKKVAIPMKDGTITYKTQFIGASNLDELNKRLYQSCMLRRLKKDVLTELPPKRRQIIVFESPVKYDDRDLYHDMNYENYEDCVARLHIDKIRFQDWSRRRHEQAITKIPFVVEHMRNALENSEKIVLFAHHRDVILELNEQLQEFNPVMFTGETNDKQRILNFHSFQCNPDTRIFLASITAAGVGLTLTVSSHLIFAEIDPVPGRINQAEDRIHRIGQKNSVLIQHLVLNKTLDAHMAKIIVRKQEWITRTLNNDGAEVP